PGRAVEVPEEMPPRPLPASRLTGFGRQLRLVACAIEQPPDDGWHRLPAARGRREGLRAGAGGARHAAERRMHAARARIHGVGRAGVAVVARWGRVGRPEPLDYALVPIRDDEPVGWIRREVERAHALGRIEASVAAGIGAVRVGGLACQGGDRAARRRDLSGSRRGSCSPAWTGVAAPPADPWYGGAQGPSTVVAPSRWMRANRRYLGVSSAASHATHLLAIFALGGWSLAGVVTRAGVPAAALGGIAYAFLAAMTATSFDRTAAWLGPRRWSRLHTTGAYYLWAIFFVSFAPRVLQSPLYWPFAIVLLAAFVLRLSDRRLRRTAGFTVATAR